MKHFYLKDDDIEPQEDPSVAIERGLHFADSNLLSEKKLRFVAAWTGNLVAAARTAGYKDPRAAAYRLMKDPEVVKALQQKQDSLLQESGEHLARTLPLSRADVIDRLWQLAQLHPCTTNSNITGQVKAAQALEQIFALNIDENDLLKRQLEGRTQEELEFYVVHGFLPHQEPKLAEAPPPQLPESTAASATAEPFAALPSTDENAEPMPQ